MRKTWISQKTAKIFKKRHNKPPTPWRLFSKEPIYPIHRTQSQRKTVTCRYFRCRSLLVFFTKNCEFVWGQKYFLTPRNFNAALVFVFAKKNLGRIPVLLPGFGRNFQKVFCRVTFFLGVLFHIITLPVPQNSKKVHFSVWKGPYDSPHES